MQTAFPFAFKVFQTTDVLVIQTDPYGNNTDLTLTSNYSVSLNSNQDTTPGGTVNLVNAPAAGYTITLSSQVQALQSLNLANAGNFYPASVDNALDLLTILIQQLALQVDAALQFPVTTTGVSSTLPAPVANAYLGWNSAANAIINYTGIAGVAVSAAMTPVVQSATTSAALTALGGITSATALSTISANVVGHNFIDNPEARVAQRGSSGALTTSVSYVSADRWAVWQATTAAGHFNIQSTTLPQFKNMFQLGRTSAATSTGFIGMAQALESNNSISLSGLEAVLSFYAYAGANFSGASEQITVKLFSGTGTDQSVANMIAGSWTGQATLINSTATLTTGVMRYQYAVSVPSTVNQLGVEIGYTPVGTAGADDNLYITGIKLEVVPASNAVATQYVSEDYSVELDRCFRYARIVTAYGAVGQCFSTTNAAFISPGPPMRASPTYVGISSLSMTTASGGTVAMSSLTGIVSSVEGIAFTGIAGSGLVAGNATFVASGSGVFTADL